MRGRELISWNVRKLRSELGISQEQLAADAEIDRAYMGGIERTTENPSIDTLDKIAGALRVPVAQLLVAPAPREKPPVPLKRGRKPRAVVNDP